jgi:hypothetical protein
MEIIGYAAPQRIGDQGDKGQQRGQDANVIGVDADLFVEQIEKRQDRPRCGVIQQI